MTQHPKYRDAVDALYSLEFTKAEQQFEELRKEERYFTSQAMNKAQIRLKVTNTILSCDSRKNRSTSRIRHK